MKKSPYLRKRPDSPYWWFRIGIPADVFPRCLEWKHRAGHDITFSLRTDSLAKANPLAVAFAERYLAQFEEQRALLGTPLPVDADLAVQLKPILADATNYGVLRFDDEVHREDIAISTSLRGFIGPHWPSHPTPERVAQAYHDAIDRATGRMTLLEHPTQEKIAKVVVEWGLEMFNLSCPAESCLYAELLEHTKLALLGAFRKLQVRCNGFEVPTPYAAEDAADLLGEFVRGNVASPEAAAASAAAPRPTASHALPQAASLPEAATPTPNAVIGNVSGTVGDPGDDLSVPGLMKHWTAGQIKQKERVNTKTAKSFCSELEKYAAFSQKSGRSMFDKLTLANYANELLKPDDKGEVPRARKATAKKNLGYLKAIFQCAVDLDLLPFNPCGVLVKQISVGDSDRLPFAADEITRFFGTPLYLERCLPRSTRAGGWAAYYIQLLMYELGSREEEFADLPVAALQWTEGSPSIPYFSIPDGKNEYARRAVPVPPHAKRLGILEYFASLPPAGMMWPLLKPDGNGHYSTNFSKWINGTYLRKTVGIVDRKKVVYSFRHNFIDDCTNALIPDPIAYAIVGHSPNDKKKTVHQKYGLGVSVETMLACLEQLESKRKGFPL